MGREGNRQAYPCRMFVAGEAPVARRTTGSAIHPVVAARKERPRPRERTNKSWEGKDRKVLPHQPDSSCSWAGERGGRRRGARADRVASGGRWGSEGRGNGLRCRRASLRCRNLDISHLPPCNPQFVYLLKYLYLYISGRYKVQTNFFVQTM